MPHGRHKKEYSLSCIVLCTLYGNKHSSVACCFKILLSVAQFSKCAFLRALVQPWQKQDLCF